MPSRFLAPSPAMTQALQTLVDSQRIAPLRPLAAPWVLDGTATRAMAVDGAVLLTAVERLIHDWAQGAGDVPPDALPQLAAEAARRDVAAGHLLGATRLDVVCPTDAPERFVLLEVQAGDPSAMGWHDLLVEAFAPHAPGVAPLPHSLRHRLERAFAQRTTGRRIAFAVASGSLVEGDHQALADFFTAAGWQARVVAPSALAFDGERLRAEGQVVDAVFRDALDELVGDALHAAHKAGAAVVLNPFAAAVADDKAMLEALSSPARWPAAVAAVLAAHVPWTRVVGARNVEVDGVSVALPDYVRQHREALVLKPVDGYGGFGVTVGRHVTAAAWEAVLETALTGPRRWVVQRAVEVPRARVAVLGGEPADCFVVHSLWFFQGAFAGAYVRTSPNPVVNVHQGGGLGPVFFSPVLE